MILKLPLADPPAPDTLDAQAQRAAADPRLADAFIAAQLGFIRGTARRVTGRPVGDSDEEWSTALLAFTEALRTYRPERGHFQTHAYQVIARRLADQQRRQQRTARELAVPPHLFTGEGDEDADATLAHAIQAAAQPAGEREGLRDELAAATALLAPFGITFMDLTRCSPQTRKTRQACARAVACLLGDGQLLAAMHRKRALPAKGVSERTGIPIKLLDRHRRYILAATLLMQGDYPFLQEYLHFIREELRV